MNTCEVCNTQYEPKRASSKYCSDKCKQKSYRNKVSATNLPAVTLRDWDNLTIDEIIALSNTEARLILAAWKDNKGTQRQRMLANIALQ